MQTTGKTFLGSLLNSVTMYTFLRIPHCSDIVYFQIFLHSTQKVFLPKELNFSVKGARSNRRIGFIKWIHRELGEKKVISELVKVKRLTNHGSLEGNYCNILS